MVLKDTVEKILYAASIDQRSTYTVEPTLPWAELLVARACLDEASLAESAKEFLKKLANPNANVADLIRARAIEDLRAASAKPVMNSVSRGWLPARVDSAYSMRQSRIAPRWVVENRALVHGGGDGEDLLFFPYPLAGKFQVSFETRADAGLEAGASFGGMVFEPRIGGEIDTTLSPTTRLYGMRRSWPRGRSLVNSLGEAYPLEWLCGSIRPEGQSKFAIDVDGARVRCLVNDKVFFEYQQAAARFPWFALHTGAGRHSEFSKLAITGEPKIPSSVTLVAKNRLDGWFPVSRGDSRPTYVGAEPIDSQGMQSKYNRHSWFAKDGVIVGTQKSDDASPAPSLLQFARPLGDGESLTYEYFYDPGRFDASPAIGSLAFVFDPKGLKLHWISELDEGDWTGLSAENIVDDPKGKSGPLSLKSGEWNKVELSLKNGVVHIGINGKPAGEVSLEGVGIWRSQFGLYHDRTRTSAKVRNVVLSGHWPKELSNDRLRDLLKATPGEE